MFVVLQIPLADSRPFLAQDPSRLRVPTWPSPDPYSEFTRGFGPVRRRRRGGVEGWLGEGTYCRADNALRFEPLLGTRFWSDVGCTEPSCLFRRLLSDGRAVNRVEVGFALRDTATRSEPLEGRRCVRIIDKLLDLPVRIPHGRDAARRTILGGSGRYLAQHLLASSTDRQKGDLPESEEWWVSAGPPVIVVEHPTRGMSSLPPNTRIVDDLGTDSIQLAFCSIEKNGRPVDLWLLGFNEGFDWDYRRRLRIHLLHLHAERQCLLTTIRHIAREHIEVERGAEASDRLQEYLRDAIRLLNRETRHGIRQPEILKTALRAQDSVSEGERTTLLSQVAGIRLNIRRSLEQITEAQPEGPPKVVSVRNGDIVEVERRSAGPELKVLFLAANPVDTTQLQLQNEFSRIDKRMWNSEFRDRFDLAPQFAVKLKDLSGFLLRYRPHVVHFSGHGSPQGELVFEDLASRSDTASQGAIADLFRILKDDIRCVLLNACYSKSQAEAIAEHIDCVIGTTRAISDSAAIEFAGGFYRAIGYARDVRTAFELGCNEIDLTGLNEADTPQLIARPGVHPRDLFLITPN